MYAAAEVHLLQSLACCVFRDALLHTLVAASGYLSYCCIPIDSCRWGHIYMPECTERLPCDWLIQQSCYWAVIRNKVVGECIYYCPSFFFQLYCSKTKRLLKGEFTPKSHFFPLVCSTIYPSRYFLLQLFISSWPSLGKILKPKLLPVSSSECKYVWMLDRKALRCRKKCLYVCVETKQGWVKEKLFARVIPVWINTGILDCYIFITETVRSRPENKYSTCTTQNHMYHIL